MYKEEILQIVRGALEDAIDRVPDDSRREHVLKAIVKAMPVSDEPRKKGHLEDILRGYQSMSNRTRKSLEDMGFLDRRRTGSITN